MRTSYMASHTDEDLSRVLDAFRTVGIKHGIIDSNGGPGPKHVSNGQNA